MEYSEAIEFLLSLSDMERGYQASPNPTMSLDSMRSLLGRLNDPHLGRPTVHITGSKGKGSTSAMIAGVLLEAGYRTALYTSPHLHSFTERIAIDGEPVRPEEFAAGLAAIRGAVEAERESVHGDVSTFGVLTALFFWLVRAQVPRVDWQVVEVGLGGTFDATNVFEATDVAVITPISLEHTAILGPTTTAIAKDKSGIIKRGTTAVVAPQRDPAVLEVTRARCEEVGAELVDVRALYTVEPGEKHPFGQAFRVRGPAGEYAMRTPMLGRHQLDNAATAVAVAEAIRAQGFTLSDRAIVEGIARTRVPGRMEVMGQRPLIVADGAHNGESAEALAAALREYFSWKRCFLVIGVTRDKDLRSMGFQLARLAELIVCVGFRNPRSMDPYQMIQEIGFLGPAAVAEESVAAGLETALAHANEDDLVCVTGSLYVVAEAREVILGESVIRK
ncbi:folylpolyglutamate synthase/dihydrofolate synthase family protein [Tepidiforma sp.]|uniref:bifunctional folylpolyglutamate synthase/dihydrofolate synthase n=1 Tax=Tepidiforma sp. TaxID=2682230 RepID=UPI002ADDF7FE|nr:folylpolyglutamate synthase/dihydrofolate synthase family protein [Tepidiforma sp.]